MALNVVGRKLLPLKRKAFISPNIYERHLSFFHWEFNCNQLQTDYISVLVSREDQTGSESP